MDVDILVVVLLIALHTYILFYSCLFSGEGQSKELAWQEERWAQQAGRWAEAGMTDSSMLLNLLLLDTIFSAIYYLMLVNMELAGICLELAYLSRLANF